MVIRTNRRLLLERPRSSSCSWLLVLIFAPVLGHNLGAQGTTADLLRREVRQHARPLSSSPLSSDPHGYAGDVKQVGGLLESSSRGGMKADGDAEAEAEVDREGVDVLGGAGEGVSLDELAAELAARVEAAEQRNAELRRERALEHWSVGRSDGRAGKTVARESAVRSSDDERSVPRELRQAVLEQLLCATERSGKVMMEECNKSESQLWYIEGPGNLMVKNSSKCLAQGEMYKLEMVACADAPSQKWRFDGIELKNGMGDNDCATMKGTPELKIELAMGPCTKDDKQKLYLFPPFDCEWATWNEWDPCTATCGGGTHSRNRSVYIEAEPFAAACAGDSFQMGKCSRQGCPVACAWGNWRSWGLCSTTCGGGVRKRSRVVAMAASDGGAPCEGGYINNKSCSPEPCPQDCIWDVWQEWEPCPVSCGAGKRKRLRTTQRLAKHKGRPCANAKDFQSLEGLAEIGNADQVASPQGMPGEWSKCSEGLTPIGIGYFELEGKDSIEHKQQLLEFECSLKENGCRVFCIEAACNFQTRCADLKHTHGTPSKVVTGGKNEWGPKATCPGKKQRIIGIFKLAVLESAPMAGVLDFRCAGEDDRALGGKGEYCQAKCKDSECELQVICGILMTFGLGAKTTSPAGGWGPRSECPEGALVTGLNQVKFMDPFEGLENLDAWDCDGKGCRAWCHGSACTVVSRCVVPQVSQSVFMEGDCGTAACPTDCELADWADWTTCTVTCGGGMASRTRLIQLNASDGGRQCPIERDLIEHRVCNRVPCPISCMMGDWGDWTVCTHTCGGGQKVRERVLEREDQYGGEKCKETTTDQLEACGTMPCPINCVWEDWQAWSECTKSCAYDGSRERTRKIKHAPEFGGADCLGETSNLDETCADVMCPIDCVLDKWTPWTPCSTTCGIGAVARKRGVHVPAMYLGKACEGKQEQTRPCFNPTPCFDDA